MQKASVLLSLFKAWPSIKEQAPHLPAALANLVTNPPPASLWVPEAHAFSLWLLAWEAHAGGDPQRYENFALGINRDLLSMPFYRMIFRALGERLTVRAIGVAWSSFHRGIEQTVTLSPGAGEIELRHPAGLMPQQVAGSFGTAYRAGLELIGATVDVADCVEFTPDRTRLSLRWH